MLESAYGHTETVKVGLTNGAKVNEKFEGVTILRIATEALEDYAALLRKLDRNEEADQLEERARAIRGKEQ